MEEEGEEPKISFIIRETGERGDDGVEAEDITSSITSERRDSTEDWMKEKGDERSIVGGRKTVDDETEDDIDSVIKVKG